MKEHKIEWDQIITHPRKFTKKCIHAYYPDLYEDVLKQPGATFSEKLYRFYHPNVQNICPICGSHTSFNDIKKGYSKYCSCKCNYIGSAASRKQTNLKRYGVENPSSSQIIKEKVKQTCIERYGVENTFQSEEKKKKAKQTCLEKYGFEYASSSKEFRERVKQTNLKRYGVENTFQSEEKKKKAKQTCLEKYGVENPAQSKEIQEKIKQIFLERYNVDNILLSIEIREKIKQTNLERYGVENPFESQEIQEQIKQTNLERYGVENPQQSEEIREKTIKTCMDKYGVPYGFLRTETGYSKISQEYFKSLDEQYPHAQYATKGGEYQVGPYRLDWYDPDSNTVIEFNGDYWHANPKLYSPDWIHPLTNKTAKEIWKYDDIRRNFLELLGYKVKVVWESDISHA